MLLPLLFISTVSASEIQDCNDLVNEAQNLSGQISCSSPSEHVRNEKERTSANLLSPNGLETEIQLYNKGAYAAYLQVEYYTRNADNSLTHHIRSSNYISVLLYTSITIPGNAENVKVRSVLNTQLAWQREKDIFIVHPSSSDNVWVMNKDLPNSDATKIVNIMQYDVWGTTFHAASGLVRASGTYKIDMNDGTHVIIYEHLNQQGNALIITSDVPMLPEYFNDKMSSWYIPDGMRVNFFEHGNYKGRAYSRSAGSDNAGVFNDKISAIKIFGK